jgi:cell fate (sporulation/competence/biofilm development) regulator YmcA (YheA/YmcA/DUF963 family)
LSSRYDKAIEDCSSSIDKDVGYVKAYFRRAKAKFNLGCMIDAKVDKIQKLTQKQPIFLILFLLG